MFICTRAALYFLALILISPMAYSKAKPVSLQGAWQQGGQTVVNLSTHQSPQSCKNFQVHIGQSLNFKIQCEGQFKSEVLGLSNKERHTVSFYPNQITITKYAFLEKKPQVSRFQQSSIKVPYVNELIHIKRQKSGELSVYIEKFKVDEFGRIVQDSYLQAYGLAEKMREISQNKNKN